MPVFVVMPLFTERMLRFCGCDYISAYADNGCGAVAVIGAAVRDLCLGIITAVVSASVPVPALVVIQFIAENVSAACLNYDRAAVFADNRRCAVVVVRVRRVRPADGYRDGNKGVFILHCRERVRAGQQRVNTGTVGGHDGAAVLDNRAVLRHEGCAHAVCFAVCDSCNCGTCCFVAADRADAVVIIAVICAEFRITVVCVLVKTDVGFVFYCIVEQITDSAVRKVCGGVSVGIRYLASALGTGCCFQVGSLTVEATVIDVAASDRSAYAADIRIAAYASDIIATADRGVNGCRNRIEI